MVELQIGVLAGLFTGMSGLIHHFEAAQPLNAQIALAARHAVERVLTGDDVEGLAHGLKLAEGILQNKNLKVDEFNLKHEGFYETLNNCFCSNSRNSNNSHT